MQSRRVRRIFAAAVLALAGAACSGGEEAGSESPAGDGAAVAKTPDPAAGEEIYGNVCATCHGGSPKAEGTAGPAIAGSSLALVEAKVVRGEYPPGYTPKRNTRAMPPLPYLEDYVADIAAYLQAAGDG
jgi:mono/diheme cytochrome c family protein